MRGQFAISVMFVVATVTLVVVFALAFAAYYGRPRIAANAQAILLRHNALFRGVTLVMVLGVPLGFTILVWFVPLLRSEVPYLLGLYLPLIGLSLALYWESHRFYLLLTPDGVKCRSPWRGRRFFSWSDVESVSFSSINSWFVVRAAAGGKMRVHSYVAGVAEFLRIIELRMPAQAFRDARPGYARLGRTFPQMPDEPILESLPPL